MLVARAPAEPSVIETTEPRTGRRAVPAQFGMDEVLWAAWLYYEQGQKQDRIAEELGISRASVFNLLQKARDGLWPVLLRLLPASARKAARG